MIAMNQRFRIAAQDGDVFNRFEIVKINLPLAARSVANVCGRHPVLRKTNLSAIVISQITGMIMGRRPVVFWMRRLSSVP